MPTLERKYFVKTIGSQNYFVIVDEIGRTSKHNEFGFRIEPFKDYPDQQEACAALESKGWRPFHPYTAGRPS